MSGSDPGGLRSARREGAIPLSITVSTAGSNPAGVGSTPNRGCQVIRSEIVYTFLFFIGRRIRSVQRLKSDAMRTAYPWCKTHYDALRLSVKPNCIMATGRRGNRYISHPFTK